MRSTTRGPWALALAVALVVPAGCGGGDDEEAGGTADATTATTLPATTSSSTSTTLDASTTTTAGPGTSLPQIKVGTSTLEDDFTGGPAKGGWPAEVEGATLRYDRNLNIKAAGTSPVVVGPTVAGGRARDVSVTAEIRGIALSLSYSDGWGIACRHEGGSYYGFAVRGGAVAGSKPASKAFEWLVYRADGGTTKQLAAGEVDLGGSLFTLRAACSDGPDGADLRFVIAGTRVSRVVDPSPLTGTGTGVVLQSAKGGSTLTVSSFGVAPVTR